MTKILQNLKGKYLSQRWQVCALALLILISTSCTNNTAEKTLSEYLDNTFLDNNGKKAYELISSDDKKYISKNEFISETKRKNIFNENFLRSCKRHFSYEIVETKHRGSDTTVLKVLLKKPNMSCLLNEIVTYTMASSYAKVSGRNKHQIIDQKLDKMMAKNGLKIETEVREFILINENRRYKVYLNLNTLDKHKMTSKGYGYN